MIAIEGQFFFNCSSGGRKDFIDVSDLKHFEVVEMAGNILPIFKLIFTTNDDLIAAKLHEGQHLNVQFGRSNNEFEDMVLCCNKVHANQSSVSTHEITVSGFLGKNNFLSQPKINITGEMSGVAAVKLAVSSHFNYPKTNLQTSQDSQKWVQYNTSDRNFVFDTLLHSYRKGSVIAFAACINGDFRVIDVKDDLAKKSSKVDWLISNSSKQEKAIKHNPYQVQSSHGLMNTLGTYGYEINTITPETDTKLSHTQKPEIMMAMAKSVSKSADVEKRYFGTQMQNKNVHENFWRSYQQNIVGLLSLSTVKIILPLASSYQNIHPLDVVMFKDISLQDDKTSNELYSGVYLVSQVRRVISDKTCITYVELCREALNGVKNAN